MRVKSTEMLVRTSSAGQHCGSDVLPSASALNHTGLISGLWAAHCGFARLAFSRRLIYQQCCGCCEASLELPIIMLLARQAQGTENEGYHVERRVICNTGSYILNMLSTAQIASHASPQI